MKGAVCNQIMDSALVTVYHALQVPGVVRLISLALPKRDDSNK